MRLKMYHGALIDSFVASSAGVRARSGRASIETRGLRFSGRAAATAGRPTTSAGASLGAFVLSLFILASAGTECAQAQSGTAARASPSAPAAFDVQKGRWVRPDGGYMIAITSVAADGTLEAAYANPRPLPFAVARAKRERETLSVFLELRAGGYNGSTYTLVYDPVNDVLKGVYYQAVAQQRFDVRFVRAR